MKTKRKIIMIGFVAVVVFVGCGGGGGSSAPTGESLPPKILSWTPPSAYTDNTSLDPARDLAYFEVYVNRDGVFSTGDAETATLAALDPTTRQITTSFDLSNLGSFVSRGVTYYVSVRAVAINGLKSDFSSAASFSF